MTKTSTQEPRKGQQHGSDVRVLGPATNRSYAESGKVPLQPNRVHARYKNPEGVPNAGLFPSLLPVAQSGSTNGRAVAYVPSTEFTVP